MTIFALAAALAFGTAAPEPAPAPAPIAPAVRSDAKRADAENRRICVVDTTTGSRLERKTCLTRAQWAAEGIDPLAKR